MPQGEADGRRVRTVLQDEEGAETELLYSQAGTIRQRDISYDKRKLENEGTPSVGKRMAGSAARMRTWTMVPVRTGDNGWHQPDRQPRKGRCSRVGSGDKDVHHIFFRGGAFRKNR